MIEFTKKHAVDAMKRVYALMKENRDSLIELDSKIGDGDLGLTLVRGFSAAADTAESIADSDLGMFFTKVGLSIIRAAPSTMGTLLGSALLGAGKALSGREQLDGTGFALLFRSMAEAAAERGNAGEGEKTLLDVLFPAARAVEGCDSPDIWKRAQAGLTQAKISLENTRALMSQHGKAAVFREKTIGLADPGAAAACLLIEGIVTACKPAGVGLQRQEGQKLDREKVYQMYRELAARETAYREEQSENDRRLGIKDLYREEAARGTRMLYELGFSPSGDNGDISVRDPETGLVYISASPIEIGYKNLGEYHACDMAVVDMEGNRMTTWSRPTIEMPMHLAILRARPDVNAVVHTHAAWSSVFAICGKNIPFVLAEQYAHLGAGEVVCAGYGKAGSDELGEEIVSALGKNNAVLMRNHGAVTVGRTLDEAFTNARFLECIAQKALFATLLGGLQTVNPEDVAEEWAK